MPTLKRKNADGNWEYIQVSGLDVAQLRDDVDSNTTALADKVKKGELIVSVKDYGAKGDGTTDDTTSIQNALNTLPVNSVLLFPVGTYKVTSQLTWNGAVSLMGFNRENTIIKASGTFSALLAKKDESVGICGQITGLTFDGNGTVDYVFDFPRGKGLKAYRNFFKNAKLRTVRFGSSATWGAYEIHFFDNNVFGLEDTVGVATNRPDYALELAGNCSDSAFYDNIVTNSKIAGIISNGTHNDVHDNHIYGYPNDYIMQYCISVTGATNNTYFNRLDTPNEAGIFVNKWGNRIESNMIFWNGTMTDLTGKRGIKIDNTANNVTYLNVNDNFVQGTSAVPPNDITVIGNLPDHSSFKGNYGNVTKSLENNYKGQISVASGATSATLTFDVPFTQYNYGIQVSANWYTNIRVFRSLGSVAIQFQTAPSVASEIYYKIDAW
jgi:hypothetical protein